MRMEIIEALITMVLCGVLGAVIWYSIHYIQPTAPSLWWLVVAVVLVGVIGGILIVAIDHRNTQQKSVIHIQDLT